MPSNSNKIINQNQLGFTLIEMLVYTALFGLMFSCLLPVCFALIENLDTSKTRAMVQQEGDFILAKIDWAAASAHSAEADATSLILTNPDHIIKYDAASDAQNIKLDGQILNASAVKIKDANFTVNGAAPAVKIEVSFLIYSKTPLGKSYQQPFAAVYYLHNYEPVK